MLDNFQSLRFLFIITVLVEHFNYAGIEGKSTGIGVTFFFILSGFLMARTYGQKVCDRNLNFKVYILRRFAKLYPTHLICLLIFIVTRLHVLDAINWPSLTINVLLLQSWIPQREYYFGCTSVPWFLSDIIFIYSAFPFVYRFIGRTGKQRTLLITTFIVLIYATYTSLLRYDDFCFWRYVFPPVRLAEFCMGLLAYRTYQLYPKRGKLKYCSFVELLLILACLASIITYPIIPKFHVSFLHWFIIIPIIVIFWLGEQYGGGIMSRIFHKPLLPWLGGLTMEVFLLHVLVYDIIFRVIRHLGINPPFIPLLIIAIITTYISAYILHTIFVKPITEKLMKAITRKQSPQPK